MEWIIIICLTLALLLIGMLSLRRNLMAMNEHVNNAMTQIGIQVSGHYEALMKLLALLESCAPEVIRPLIELAGQRRFITAESTPADVLAEESRIAYILVKCKTVTTRFPALTTTEDYEKLSDAVDCYEKMLDTSRLIYNDSVKRINHTLTLFPLQLPGRLLGFCQRDYLYTNS